MPGEKGTCEGNGRVTVEVYFIRVTRQDEQL